MDQQKTHRYCVIMCGGIGSRFWPYSRESRPKQFIDFLGTGRSLLQMSYDRVLPVVPKENVIIVTNAQYAPLIKEQLPEISDSQILLEPARRNTAPCIAWAAYHIRAIDPEASMIVTPSDHLITRDRDFEASILRGFEFVESRNALLTLGIKPTRPETGYGYIQIGKEVEPGISHVKTFTEKPDRELAKVFVDSGEFFWNSGIFLWRASSIIEALHEYAPEIAQVFDHGEGDYGTPAEKKFIDYHFPGCLSISIDYAVMEKSKNVYVECVDFGWNDLGTWSALFDNSPKNREGNVVQRCNVLAHNSSGNIFAVSGEKLVVVQGLHDYIVADAGDVLLICPKSEEQGIKQMVNDAKLKFGDKFL
ncbi:MAG: mannose-1-phosphate guanylyltransferase [Bacteroidales bacterium]|nr:mannose-1-phosphate guanylyltransferase [Bacteroidales bacterium]